jgi:hypothetical protein
VTPPAPQADVVMQPVETVQESQQDASVNNDASFGGPTRIKSQGGGKGIFGQPTQQSGNRLVCITLDTYKAARLNSILS